MLEPVKEEHIVEKAMPIAETSKASASGNLSFA